MTAQRWIGSLAGVGVLALAGCGSDDEPWREEGAAGAAAIVNELLTAVDGGDPARICARLDERAQADLQRATSTATCLDAAAKVAAKGASGEVSEDDVLIPSVLEPDPPRDSRSGIQYLGEAADVTLPSGVEVPGLTKDGKVVVVWSAVGWGVTAPS